jgi:ceramide glucosyltransferase
MSWIHHASAAHLVLAIGRCLAATVCFSAIAYYAYAARAAKEFFSRDVGPARNFQPPVTILKPIRGLDRDAYENFASFCRQQYPTYQVIFGAESEREPAAAVAQQIRRDFPDVDIQVVIGASVSAANPKVGNLAGILPFAKHSLLLISDSDIRVEPTHLRRFVHSMADPRVGVVTCLYRSSARGFAGAMDALGLSTDFQPSVLVARKLEGITFGMGSGILIRRVALDAIGGFAAIGDYLADDYHLGNRPAEAGYRVELSDCVVEHRLGTATLAELVAHQIRWNRGIRASRPWGYAGLLLTQGVSAGVLLLLLAGGAWPAWAILGATLAARLGMAWYVAVRCLDDAVARRFLWLVPLRDLLTGALWLGAYFGNSVEWRGTRFLLRRGGRLTPATPDPAPAWEPLPKANSRT